MPRLPTVGLDAGSSGRYDAPGTIARRDATGQQLGNLGDALQGVGAGLSRIGQEERERFDDARVNEAMNRFLEFDMNERNRHGALVGKAAVDDEAPTREKYTEFRHKLDEGLDPHQRGLLGPHLERRMIQSLGGIQGHATEQGQRWQAAENDTAWKLRAARYAADLEQGPAEAARTKAEALAHVDEFADLQGYGPERTAALRLAATTAMHEGVLQGQVTRGRVSDARAYLDANRGEIAPESAMRLERTVQTATIADESTRFAMWAQDQAAKRGGTIEAQQEYALSIADQTYKGKKITAEVRDEAQQRIAQGFRRLKVAEAGSDNQLLQEATRALDAVPMSSPADLEPALREKLTSRGLMGDVNLWASNRRFVTDPKAFAEIMSMPEQTLRGTSPAELIRQYRGRLDDTDLKGLLAAHAKSVGQASKQDIDLLTERDRVDEAFHKATKTRRDKELTDDQQQRRFLYKQRVTERLRAEGDKLTPVRFQEIMDETALDTVYVDVTGSDPSASIYTLSEANIKNAYVQVGDKLIYASQQGDASRLSVPQDERATIVRELRARRKPTTEQAIAELWVQGGMKGRK